MSKGTVGADAAAVSTAQNRAVDSADAGAGDGCSVGLDGRVRPGYRLDTAQGRARQETVLALRAQGRTQVQIAGELGVAQSTVSAYLAAAEARGLLDPASLLAGASAEGADVEAPVGESGGAGVHDTLPREGSQGAGVVARSRAGALLAEARIRAEALAGHVGVLRAQVVDAEEWTADGLFAADVDVAVGRVLAEVSGELAYVLGHLDRCPESVPVPPDAYVHVRRAHRVRQIADALANGASPAEIAADLGIGVDAVRKVAAELDALPTDRWVRREASGNPGAVS
ncbi:LuxR C-terminal-related transcriptional regulator [Cellulomonas triticagri]|uniref:LuxR C-terminal-related transcriptional regulator n=1 Tax=Cellulomonas triticagri TaxID=2483352 RepID=UPI0013159BA7|nr:LuxR C-terminal-related transcriptional regulator [Cellulomonas triticagri]